MCLAPYNLTEAAISARELACQSMELLFDKKEEMSEGTYLIHCDGLKGLYDQCDKLLLGNSTNPFCEWEQEDQLEIKNFLARATHFLENFDD
tara:strand:+ start:1008 stop:1283 length:276 start_codon:yes stop_codon:yes gene_type:complete